MDIPEIIFTSLGLVVLDEIRFSNKKPLTNVLGGSGAYATLGARLFLSHPQSSSVGLVIRAGKDFPETTKALLDSWGVALTMQKEVDRLATRGLLEYKDTTFGPKDFQYTTPVLAGGNVQNFVEAAGLVDVFSPNHIELARIFGEAVGSLFKGKIEQLALKIVARDVGQEGKGAVIIRAGEHGCLIAKKNMSPLWLPPYYDMADNQRNKVIDPTGAGNAFLGAYAVGYAKTRSVIQAACYGSVGASFALEQVGMPVKSDEGGCELWNEVHVQSRLQEYMSRREVAAILEG
ncbi:hypothetical protein N7532_003227 [Penicillium argentinense]|uniref:Carbohydrate kinase PfkB domain-containing protein n=1 Tax=Penicillium argentinense TaxID=1131581 RepID=A0A9W9FM22_9EURO|nr:uncharacterized protein N7532_003227 [Penicillium argentinense]KAJ5102698.1 hypothetical protein N7532_003227 [Penicillium argentinense]